jgi:ASC-1-like (ASCH) protein
MSIHKKNLSEPWFTLVQLGIKKSEGRLNKGSFSNMKKGDVILFENSELGFNRSYRVKITSIISYDTFRNFIVKEKLENCLPGIDTIENGIKVYRKYYSEKDEKEFKIIALRLKKLK